jgi:putative SOS response-associated peptidase YedK
MAIAFSSEDAKKYFNIDKTINDFQPQYNLAPTQQVPVITAGSRILQTMRWGLIPHWAKDKKIGNYNINARSESLQEKPSFRENFKKRRCLVLTSGFFEWKNKVPHFITLKTNKPFAFAGLYDQWQEPDSKKAQKIKSCTIITTKSNSFLKEIHDRMPAILSPEDYDEWLSLENTDTDLLQNLLKPFDSSQMSEYKVSQNVNSVRNQGPELIKPTN